MLSQRDSMASSPSSREMTSPQPSMPVALDHVAAQGRHQIRVKPLAAAGECGVGGTGVEDDVDAVE